MHAHAKQTKKKPKKKCAALIYLQIAINIDLVYLPAINQKKQKKKKKKL